MGQRKKARELALKCLYAFESTGEPIDSVTNGLIAESDLSEENQRYADRLFRKVVELTPALDRRIERFSEHWRLERIAMVDKNILRLSICEMVAFPDIPSRVAVNEGVELAKKYSSQEAARFVNGILDAVLKHLEEVEWSKEG
jgi:N utilization substance protein B